MITTKAQVTAKFNCRNLPLQALVPFVRVKIQYHHYISPAGAGSYTQYQQKLNLDDNQFPLFTGNKP